jgi:hypothetical protein
MNSEVLDYQVAASPVITVPAQVIIYGYLCTLGTYDTHRMSINNNKHQKFRGCGSLFVEDKNFK